MSDWQALETLLDAQDDVERIEEDKWNWCEHFEDGWRTRAWLERHADGTLAAVCRTESRTEATRLWLKELAGSLLTLVDSKSEDVRDIIEQRRDAQEGEPTPAQHDVDTSPEAQQLLHDFILHHYSKWLTDPLPVLNGKTPMQAVKLKTYRPRGVELLKTLEQKEARHPQGRDGQPFDFSFLWERLGLTRERDGRA